MDRFRAAGIAGILVLVALLILAVSPVGCEHRSIVGRPAARKASALGPPSITYAADTLRTGWYPDQPNLSPAAVQSPSFRQLFSTPLSGQIYAQPLVSQGIVFVATEANNIYGVDGESGAVLWTRNVGAPFRSDDIGCADLAPSIGITGTPVIDPATNTAYFFAKSYVGTSTVVVWNAHAVDVATGQERSGFPVLIQGTSTADPRISFDPYYHLQRPGLLLLDGVVYAAFGAHCDIGTYFGWVAGVSTDGRLVTLWTAEADPANAGAGIWQSGGGLVSDGSGRIFLTTGNGPSPAVPTPGNSPPGALGEAVVRLGVQANGALQALDFFAPYNADQLNSNDTDLGSGSPLALVDAFGTASTPHLLVQVGKEGWVYLLDRDNLGGIGNGPGAQDAVVARVGPRAGLWGKPSLWPGDGRFIYITTADSTLDAYQFAVDGSGRATLVIAGSSADNFGFGSSSPVITSDGTTSGTALLWVIRSMDGSGNGAELRAYNPVPVNATLVPLFSAPVGVSVKFALPGVGAGRVYVGNKDGALLGFGAPRALLAGASLDFGSVPMGQASVRTATLTAAASINVSDLSSTNSAFTLGVANPGLPAMLQAGGTIHVPVTFRPQGIGPASGSIVATTDTGTISAVRLSGTGQAPTPVLAAAPTMLAFGTVAIGSTVSGSLSIANAGGGTLTIESIGGPPSPPFAIMGAPALPYDLGMGESFALTIVFMPTALGAASATLTIASNAGTLTVPISADVAPPGQLVVMPLSIDYGGITVGSTLTRSFTVLNNGGTPIRFARSKPPSLGTFHADTALAEGTLLGAGAMLTESVSFVPTSTGAFADDWQINSDDRTGLKIVNFTGRGLPRNAAADGGLTDASATEAGAPPDAGPSPQDAAPPSDAGGGHDAAPLHADAAAADGAPSPANYPLPKSGCVCSGAHRARSDAEPMMLGLAAAMLVRLASSLFAPRRRAR